MLAQLATELPDGGESFLLLELKAERPFLRYILEDNYPVAAAQFDLCDGKRARRRLVGELPGVDLMPRSFVP